MIRVGFLYTRLRVEEKYLLEELERMPKVEVLRIPDGGNFFDITQKPAEVHVLFVRSVSYSRGIYISRIFEAYGIPVVNSTLVAERCGDKYVTRQLLMRNGIPTPRVLIIPITPHPILFTISLNRSEKLRYETLLCVGSILFWYK